MKLDTLDAPARYEEAVRRSRFITHAARVDREADTLAFYESVADPGATHNCWAWRLDLRVRFNDDGEPGGTAGRPMLGVLEARNLDHVMVVVTRHFGGIKLGAGGLVRAYSGAVARCLDQATIVPLDPPVSCRIEAAFDDVGTLHALLARHGAEKTDEQWHPDGLRLDVNVATSRLAALSRDVEEWSRGAASLRRLQSPEAKSSVTPGSDSA